MTVSVGQTAVTLVLAADPATCSLKRAAWAFGCAKKGSEEERHLRDLLFAVVERERRAEEAGRVG